jgi:hypothetical protein
MLTLIELIVPPFYLVLILLVSYLVQQRHVKTMPIYRYYTAGLLFKLAGGIAICLVYTLYYGEGDTTNFFYHGGNVLLNLFLKSPGRFFEVVFGELNAMHWSYFDSSTSWPYYYRDPNSFFVVRITSLIALFTFRSYIATTLILAWISYTGVWRLYKVFCDVFPEHYRQLALAILFIPSVAFWGSGLLKDTITLSGVGWYTYGFYKLFIRKEKYLLNIFILLLSSYFILAIKPYIFYALMPGSLIWLSIHLLKNLENPFIRRFTSPIILLISISVGYLFVDLIGRNMGKFSIDTILERAVITQQDLKREAYGTNSFDVGTFDASVSSIVSKAPAAMVAGLFRPFLWEVRNPMMLLSALESAVFLYLLLYLLLTGKWKKILVFVSAHPLIFFSLVFAIFFSFSVGLTTANFGALVRYRIPALPFFLSCLLLLRSASRKAEPASLQTVQAGHERSGL